MRNRVKCIKSENGLLHGDDLILNNRNLFTEQPKTGEKKPVRSPLFIPLEEICEKVRERYRVKFRVKMTTIIQLYVYPISGVRQLVNMDV